jgi:AcrR family transcriptional regulator
VCREDASTNAVFYLYYISTEAVKVSITVEHDKRKREILEKALDVFVDEGYEDTTFQKIAERCGITRTILYLYFKNKREIFSFSIKLFTERLETSLKGIAADPGLSWGDKLVSVADMAIVQCARNAKLLSVILDYLGHLKTSGGNPDEKVRRRTIRMRHILSGILIEGQRAGEFRKIPVKATGDLVYALIEAAIFRVAILGREDAAGLSASARVLVESLRAPGFKPFSAAQRPCLESENLEAPARPEAARLEAGLGAAPRDAAGLGKGGRES